MKRYLAFCIFLIIVTCGACIDQGRNNSDTALKKALSEFPGFSAEQMARLLWAKEQNCVPSDIDEKEKAALDKATKGKCSIPLPTWLPAGFAVKSIKANLGENVNIDSIGLSIVYIKNTANGKKQVFVIEAGFEFGDCLWSDPVVVNSEIGKINLYYEPIDDSLDADSSNWGKKTKNFVMTDWIDCDSAAYPKYTYSSINWEMAKENIVDSNSFEMIPLEDTKRILASLKKL